METKRGSERENEQERGCAQIERDNEREGKIWKERGRDILGGAIERTSE